MYSTCSQYATFTAELPAGKWLRYTGSRVCGWKKYMMSERGQEWVSSNTACQQSWAAWKLRSNKFMYNKNGGWLHGRVKHAILTLYNYKSVHRVCLHITVCLNHMYTSLLVFIVFKECLNTLGFTVGFQFKCHKQWCKSFQVRVSMCLRLRDTGHMDTRCCVHNRLKMYCEQLARTCSTVYYFLARFRSSQVRFHSNLGNKAISITFSRDWWELFAISVIFPRYSVSSTQDWDFGGMIEMLL